MGEMKNPTTFGNTLTELISLYSENRTHELRGERRLFWRLVLQNRNSMAFAVTCVISHVLMEFVNTNWYKNLPRRICWQLMQCELTKWFQLSLQQLYFKVQEPTCCVFFFSFTFNTNLENITLWNLRIVPLFCFFMDVAGRGGQQFFTCCPRDTLHLSKAT
jgi:hypothetical protein